MSLSVPEAVAVGIGGVAVAAAFAWKLVAAWRGRRRIARLLRDPSASARSTALAVIGERGVRPYAGVVLEVARKEHDPEVIRELVALVRRTQWEPADRPALLELRLWAKRTAAGDAPPTVAPPAVAPPTATPPAPVPTPATVPAATTPDPAGLSNRLTAAVGERVTVVRAGRRHQSSV